MASKLVGRVVICGTLAAGSMAYAGAGKVSAQLAKLTSALGSQLVSISAAPVVAPVVTAEALTQSVSILHVAVQSLPWLTAAGCLVGMHSNFRHCFMDSQL